MLVKNIDNFSAQIMLSKDNRHWLTKEEYRTIHAFSLERQLEEAITMGILKEQNKREILQILRDSDIKHENMTLGNLFALCKLESNSNNNKFKEHNPEALFKMLQSEMKEDRELAEDIINGII